MPCSKQFQSTLSLRRATFVFFIGIPHFSFQSTLSLRRATGDRIVRRDGTRDFNPRSPCGERQSAPPWTLPLTPDFNPRSPCGERHHLTYTHSIIYTISIHALLAESDCAHSKMDSTPFRFQSTLSLRRATACPGHPAVVSRISIHALLAESDSKYHQIGPIVSV